MKTLFAAFILAQIALFGWCVGKKEPEEIVWNEDGTSWEGAVELAPDDYLIGDLTVSGEIHITPGYDCTGSAQDGWTCKTVEDSE